MIGPNRIKLPRELWVVAQAICTAAKIANSANCADLNSEDESSQGEWGEKEFEQVRRFVRYETNHSSRESLRNFIDEVPIYIGDTAKISYYRDPYRRPWIKTYFVYKCKKCQTQCLIPDYVHNSLRDNCRFHCDYDDCGGTEFEITMEE